MRGQVSGAAGARQPDQPWLSLRGRKINFLEREMRNRHLGRSGEQWVVEVERRRLLDVGRDDLAKKVEWVADTRGDGLGFDVLSFEPASDREQYLEVKTTTQGKDFPFYVTRNELQCSQATAEQYRLYRVFRFHREPRLFVVAGDLEAQLSLTPMSYAARIG